MKINKLLTLAGCAVLLTACSGDDQPAGQAAEESPPAGVFIVSPADGESVASPVTVVFGIRNFGIAPAGTYEPQTGHHHLVVDAELPPLDQPIPADDNHVHFGKGQTETVIELAPGPHTLQLLLGDGNHVPHSVALVSDPITITVLAAADAVE